MEIRITTIFGLCAFFLSAYLNLRQDGIVSAFSQVGPTPTANTNMHNTNTNTNTRRNSAAHKNSRRRATGSILAANPGGDFGEITSALATLDQQWQIQQRTSVADGQGKPRWSKLFLPKEESMADEDYYEQEEYVWMLEPPSNSIPSCVVAFTGGAGLGQFPQVAYNELLSKISDKLNAVCITVPYEVGLDHFSLAKKTGERIRRALLILNENSSDEDSNSNSNSNNDGDDDENENDGSGTSDGSSADTNIVRSRLPTYSLAHSLGCKLQTIYMAATGLENSFDGVGFMAYNNFSFAKTITMARSFAQELRGGNNNNMNMGNMGNPEMINNFFDFAEMAVGAIGVDFSPNSQDTERLIKLRYNDKLKAKTRMFVFDKDNLDSSQEFISACNDSFDGNYGSSSNNLSVSNLSGGHLTPVYFQLNTDDLAKEAMGGLGDNFSPENINMAKEAMGGFQGASFGDDEAFGGLVDEVCDWILGKPPSTASMPKISSSSSSSSTSSTSA